jgi:hypothetical protein
MNVAWTRINAGEIFHGQTLGHFNFSGAVLTILYILNDTVTSSEKWLHYFVTATKMWCALGTQINFHCKNLKNMASSTLMATIFLEQMM